MSVKIDTDAVINNVVFSDQGSNPATPSANKTRVFTKSNGLYIVNDDGNVVGPFITGSSATQILISEINATGTTVTWNNIPGGYKSLEIELMGRTDKAAVTNEAVNIYFNNDTTAGNYYRETLSAATTTVAGAAGDDSLGITLPAANATANYAGYGKAFIPDYDGTTFHKIIRILTSRRETATTAMVATLVVFWENTATITRIDLVTNSSGGFVPGTKARLYGIY